MWTTITNTALCFAAAVLCAAGASLAFVLPVNGGAGVSLGIFADIVAAAAFGSGIRGLVEIRDRAVDEALAGTKKGSR